MKFLIFLSFLVISSMVFIACQDSSCANLADSGGTCIVYDDCKTDSDCNSPYLICNKDTNKCAKNPCSWFIDSPESCGLGKCVIDNYIESHCQCDEGAVFDDGANACIPTCTDNSTCEEFASSSEFETYKYCDENTGHCTRWTSK